MLQPPSRLPYVIGPVGGGGYLGLKRFFRKIPRRRPEAQGDPNGSSVRMVGHVATSGPGGGA